MKKNIRVSATSSPKRRGDGRMSLFFPLSVSLVGHLVFLVLLVAAPEMKTDKQPIRSAIHVRMVSLKDPGGKADRAPKAETKAPVVKKKTAAKPVAPTPTKKKTAPIAKSKTSPKPKTSLKKKTFKPGRVVKHAMTPSKEKAAPTKDPSSPPETSEPLESVLERLKKEVQEAESARSRTGGTPTGEAAEAAGKLSGPYNETGKKTAERIDLYRIEIAFQIQKNWAFNEQLAGGDHSLAAAIVFKVMPDGEIRDVFFTDRSGNTYLDDSAYKAIMKSNPVDPHPGGLRMPYVDLGLRFTPQGIR